MRQQLAPSSVLFLKVFREQSCTPDDVTHVSIHSVATLMQDTLWCSPERIVPQTVWRVINYESKDSGVLPFKDVNLMISSLYTVESVPLYFSKGGATPGGDSRLPSRANAA